MEIELPFFWYRDAMAAWGRGDYDLCLAASKGLMVSVAVETQKHENCPIWDEANACWYVAGLSLLVALGELPREIFQEAIENELSEHWQDDARDCLLLGKPFDPLDCISMHWK